MRNYPWLCGKMLALAFIFVGGGFLATVIVPVALWFPGDKQERVQELIRVIFRFYIRTLHRTHMIDLHVPDEAKLARLSGVIVVANHPSLLDVVALMAFIPRAQCIIKNALWSHRFLGPLMRVAGYIRNDLPPEELVEACRTALDQKRNLIIFPEGTRTVPGEKLRFHRGFASLATLTEAPVQTILISCTPPILYKGEPMGHAPSKRPVFKVIMGECLDKDSYLLYDRRGLAARKLVAYLEGFYHKKNAHG